jgi:N,N-dimethylformamidase
VRYWPSGLYFARVSSSSSGTCFAPFVLRAGFIHARVAVVLPTNTWQAYNKRDDDDDGIADSWYASPGVTNVLLARPFLARGVPPHFQQYDLGFLRWLAHTGKQADFYADDDLERIFSGRRLAQAYDLIVFAGHEEYVTAHEYDLITAYRDAGGNLMFLSANNFFRRVDRFEGAMVLVDEWRSLGRPEAALCGVQYLASDRGQRHGAFVVEDADAADWAFAGTGLEQGDEFGVYGIEIDARAWSSPRETQVLARIPDLFGSGRSAEMTYYEHESGARVFSAGALNFGGQMLLWPEATRLVENVWAHLGGPPAERAARNLFEGDCGQEKPTVWRAPTVT